jgi:hypothetical protein
MNLFTASLTAVTASLIFTACNLQPSEPVANTTLDEFTIKTDTAWATRTHSSGPTLDASMIKSLTEARSLIHTFSDGNTMTFFNVNGHLSTGGDILIGSVKDLPELIGRYEREIRAVRPQGVGVDPAGCWSSVPTPFGSVCVQFGSSKLWPNKRVPFVIDSGITGTRRTRLQDAIDAWNNTSVDVKFVPNTAILPTAHVKFVRTEDGACGSSFVGNVGDVSGQPINIREDCFRTRTIHHEMGHAVGLWHEQQRCDRNSFVTVTSTDTTNYGRKCGAKWRDYRTYNYGSVMHYSPSSVMSVVSNPPAHRGDPNLAGQATQLNSGDIADIDTMYADQ